MTCFLVFLSAVLACVLASTATRARRRTHTNLSLENEYITELMLLGRKSKGSDVSRGRERAAEISFS